MAFYGLLLGLGVAELVGNLANLLRERERPELGLLVPLVAVIVLVETIANFVDAWGKYQALPITFFWLAPAMLVGIAYYAAAAMLVPRRLADWPSLDAYFLARRRWIVGALLFANLILIWLGAQVSGAVARAMAEERWGDLLVFLGVNVWLVGGYLLLMFGPERRSAAAGAIAILAFYFVTYGPISLTIWRS